MRANPATKYQAFEPVALSSRQWPSRVISKPPAWCSVDLRDGNQALADPMGLERKRVMFDALVAAGFKEIEVGFPAASQTEFEFIRHLIDSNLIPDDVAIQVLTPARTPHIERTFESLQGCRRAIIHLYNSTSTLQRRVVFKSDRAGIVTLAVDAARRIAALAANSDTDVTVEYTPESFTGTELDFSQEICEAVMDVVRPTRDRKIIFNLPATVELATPNVYADQIEWFADSISGRDAVILSVHPHNDRGTAVAAAELALMAGADRVEGTLFGNGERTGNVDLVTLALNMFTQGVDPGLDFSDIKRFVQVAEHCTKIPVHPRHPYAGELVFAAFSGSHQDAIKKGLAAQSASNSGLWEVPYLPIDPADVGRRYEAVIRINSQSGKGGVAFVLEHEYGLVLPQAMQIEFAKTVQHHSENGAELQPGDIWQLFEAEFLRADDVLLFRQYTCRHLSPFKVSLSATVSVRGAIHAVDGLGTGPVEAYCNAIKNIVDLNFDIVDLQQKSRSGGAASDAATYVQIQTSDDQRFYGAGIHEDVLLASLHAVTSAVNRAYRASAPEVR
ncbi:MAG: 2-isopropylmalate synthase [Rhodospirillaceae bacterium]